MLTDDEKAEKRRLTALRCRVTKARNFPANTCPASRHVYIMADRLSRSGVYPMLTEEPKHCAESMLATVAALWEARTELAKLKAKLKAKAPPC